MFYIITPEVTSSLPNISEPYTYLVTEIVYPRRFAMGYVVPGFHIYGGNFLPCPQIYHRTEFHHPFDLRASHLQWQSHDEGHRPPNP